MAIDTSDLVFTAQQLHGLTRTTAAAFGRLLTAASMMGTLLKRESASVTVKVNGGGPVGTLLARADSHGNVRGYVDHPDVDFPLRRDGKIDVGQAVGHDGRIAVIRDEGTGEPYVGQVALVSGEIAEDITAYYAYSEQIPTACMLGVLVDQKDQKVILSGGVLLQALPGAGEGTLQQLEATVSTLPSVTTMLAQGLTPLQMCEKALSGFDMEVLDEYEVNYVCNCSKARFSDVLTTIGEEEIRTLPLVKDGMAEMTCQYCNRQYYFTQEELTQIADALQAARDTKSVGGEDA